MQLGTVSGSTIISAFCSPSSPTSTTPLVDVEICPALGLWQRTKGTAHDYATHPAQCRNFAEGAYSQSHCQDKEESRQQQ
jgi:hypothetical protein